MEKDVGKIKKSSIIDIIVRIDDFGGRRGLTIREYAKGDRTANCVRWGRPGGR